MESGALNASPTFTSKKIDAFRVVMGVSNVLEVIPVHYVLMVLSCRKQSVYLVAIVALAAILYLALLATVESFYLASNVSHALNVVMKLNV